MRQDMGDFQTPSELATQILRMLGASATRWTRVLEPTCGTGTFLAAALDQIAPPPELIGIEFQETHCAAARARVGGRSESPVEIRCAEPLRPGSRT